LGAVAYAGLGEEVVDVALYGGLAYDELCRYLGVGEAVCDSVVWDPGYSLCKPGTVHHKLA
jgi:hypothetical protein